MALGGKIVSSNIEDIPRFVFDELHKLIGEKSKQKLFKYVITHNNDQTEALNLYIRNIMDKIIFVDKDTVDLFAIYDTYRKRRQQTKRNWYKELNKQIEQQQLNPINTEWEVLEKFLSQKKYDDRFKDVLPELEDNKEFAKTRLEEVKAWANDVHSWVTDYPYLDSKKPFQIDKAFENDFVFIICHFLKQAPNNQNWISHRPKSLVDNPIFADGKAEMKGNIMVDSNNTTVLYDDYTLSEDRIIRSMVELDENEQIMLDKTFVLDDVDSEIIEHVMEQRNEQFLKDQTIIVDLRPLLVRVYGDTGKKNYELIKKRLKKIGRFRFEGRKIGTNMEVTTDFIFNLFQKVLISKDEVTGRSYAQIEFSNSLHQQFINNTTIQIYSHFIHRLENKLAKRLIYAFQQERIEAYLEGTAIKNHYEYNYFYNRIRFRSKRIEHNLQIIEPSLQELKDSNIFIEDFKRNGNGFDISLMPLTDTEKEDFRINTPLSLK